jgi:hypothetical protein
METSSAQNVKSKMQSTSRTPKPAILDQLLDLIPFNCFCLRGVCARVWIHLWKGIFPWDNILVEDSHVADIPRINLWNLKPGNAISCILSIQICSKIYANCTCSTGGRHLPPSLYVKKALDFVCAFIINKWLWLCKGCFGRSLTEMSKNTKTKTKNNAQCFCNLHNLCHTPLSYHSYRGALHIWQSILKAINIGVIIFNYSLYTAVLLINFDESYMFRPNDTWISAQLPDRKILGGGHVPPLRAPDTPTIHCANATEGPRGNTPSPRHVHFF